MRTSYALAIDIASEFVPFTDIVSDVILLASVWPDTEVIAPDDVNGCGERLLWYLALSLTVIGTLVDLFPEYILLTEIMMHPLALCDRASICTLFRLIFSDGKPVVVFAASDEYDKPLHPSMLRIRDSLRRRLSAIAAGLFLRDGCMAGRNPKWTYAGLVGVLVGGELMTAIGACLFLRIEFGWPALISLAASLLALLISVRCHMRKVGEKEIHRCDESPTGNGGTLFEFLLPGPLVLIRYLLIVPVWPMLLVYSEGASFWPFSMASRGDHSWPYSADAMWVVPPDWFRVSVPDFGSSDNDSPLSYAYWVMVPPLLWALVKTVWVGLLAIARLFCWYFGHVEDWSMHPWGVYFSSPGSPFHSGLRHLQGALGLGFTIWVCQEVKRLIVFSAMLAVLVYLGYENGACFEMEWAFAFSHATWWGVMLIAHLARRKNIFKPIPPSSSAVADRW